MKTRIAVLEIEKMGVEEQARHCDMAMRRLDDSISSLKEVINHHEDRLRQGDELFTNLNRLAGKMEQHLENSHTRGENNEKKGGQ